MKEPIALAVSRSFGNRDLKFAADSDTNRADIVSCEAAVSHKELRPSRHRALALMCDGVTDVMEHEEVGKLGST